MAITEMAPSKIVINGQDVTDMVSGACFTTPITSYYREDGQLAGIIIDYYAMTPQEREDIVDWVKAHRVDPFLIPIMAEIGFDADTEEWRFPVRIRGPQGGIRYDPITETVPTRIVRRRRQPWPLPMRRAGVEG